jgi:hypothetical protein
MAGQLTIDTLKASSGVLATQNGMTGIAKAWVNYNSATQTINSSFNVSSVTYIATGNFTVNYTTALQTAGCVVGLSSNTNLSVGDRQLTIQDSPTTTSVTVYATYGGAPTTGFNQINNCIAVFSS